MSLNNYKKTLDNNPEVEEFLIQVLGIPKKDAVDLIGDVRDCSKLLEDFYSKKSNGTIDDEHFRNLNYRNDNDRWKLRTQIVKELFSQQRLSNDDNIKLGLKGGGALPSELKNECKAFIVTGLPASGKSGLSEKLAEEVGGIILDSDYAKRKLPEYKQTIGADYVHKESKSIVFGNEFKEQPSYFQSLLEKSFEISANIVVPIIGDTVSSVLKIQEMLCTWEYSVNLVHLSIDKFEATRRALIRFKNSKRYVPLDKIFYTFGDNNPTLAYYKMRVHHIDKFESFSMLDANDTRKGELHKLIDNLNADFILKISRH